MKTAGAAALTTVFPAAAPVLAAVNKFLPDDQQLPATATGDQVKDAISALPADKRAEVMAMQFDVEKVNIQESHQTARAMFQADENSKHTTRPKIALGAFRVVSFVAILIVSVWAVAVLTGKQDLAKTIQDGWPFVLAVIGPFVGWLNRYFGILKLEHQNRLNAANQQPIQGGIAGLISAFKK